MTVEVLSAFGMMIEIHELSDLESDGLRALPPENSRPGASSILLIGPYPYKSKPAI